MTQALLHLLHICDPMLPIGGFSHSYGLETYTQQEIIKSPEQVLNFLRDMLTHTVLPNDASFISLTYDACETNNWSEIIALDALCHASKLPMEIRKASQKLGIRLTKIFAPLISSELTNKTQAAIKSKELFGHYSILYGVFAHQLNIKKEDAIQGYFYNTAIGFITNAVKLIPLSQDTGQQLIYKLLPLIAELSKKALHPDLDKLGISSVGLDIRSMEHEKLYSRLYMS
ncbi:urease accessory protein UreF [Flavivirga jejuensis]|uniref:Urease accessory protein UreF n=1 Tax=Flavivirga jejuensis TaxID=870487 RepID=A0ABT8WKG8_9FLAO|nr:urease accessory protein UreF [Flavivirga jejuensis]MDO5973627.1 urease accessory protein UreF [Flavivirga jejuensis]